MAILAKINSHGFNGKTQYFRICRYAPNYIELELHNSKSDRFSDNWINYKLIRIGYPEGFKTTPTNNKPLDIYTKLREDGGWDGISYVDDEQYTGKYVGDENTLDIEILENYEEDDSGRYS
jgi:hypothetical protein|tara:strand:+ start:382 stop:744 length:363 start_codon:yes stop_codon:yes gene_type:complete